MTLFNELKRRNVFKVAASYAVVSWIVLQVADTTFPALNIPAWVMSLITILILLGFPIAMFMAWAFEMTPDGIKPTAEVPLEDSIRAQTGQKMNHLLVSGLALVLVLVMLDAYVFTDIPEAQGNVVATDIAGTAQAANPAAAAISVGATVPVQDAENAGSAQVVNVKSIAVLPFTNLSNDVDQDYFADGLTDELINKLSQVNDLQVTGRNSSFYFKGRNDELRDIGQVLGVAHLLQGSVRKSGTQLRINAQLLDVATNANLWSQTYDAQLSDIFTVQDEISAAVTTALSVTLRAGEFSLPGMTGNIEAYDEYLQGNKLWLDASNGNGSFLDAVAHFERATALDPDFAVGWLAQVEAYQSGLNVLPPSQTRDFPAKRDNAISKAVALAPEHPALLQREAQRLTQEQHYAEAERLLLPLLDSAINTNAGAALRYAIMLWSVGRSEEALRYAQQARRLEPLQSFGSWVLASILLTLDREREAMAEMERGLTLEGAALFLSGTKFIAALQAGDKAAALDVSYQFPDFGPSHMAIAEQWRDGGDAAAMAKLQELLATGDISQLQYVVYREWAVALGDPELSLKLLNMQGRAQGDIWLPLFRDIRALPGFKDYVREVGLLDYWRTTGNWGDHCRPLEGTENDFECF